MPDITKCNSTECIFKEKCYRHTSTPSDYWQSYANFYNKDKPKECEFFIDDSEKSKNKCIEEFEKFLKDRNEVKNKSNDAEKSIIEINLKMKKFRSKFIKQQIQANKDASNLYITF